MQETLLAALHAWRFSIPDNPRAWLYHTAKNKALDHFRRQRTWQEKIAPNFAQNLNEAPDEYSPLDRLFLDSEIEDSQLRMLFACCHPELAQEGQIAMILKTLCGLSVAEIAAGFLTSKDTIEKRLYRTREKIRQEGITLEVPQGIALQTRLDGVLKAIYLLFNEGYHSASDDNVIRRDLCEEALHLADLLTRHRVLGVPKAHALHALLCFQASRLDSRMDEAGQIVLLEHQDRSRWDRSLISQGFSRFSSSAEGGEISEYHLEAAIASYHAQASTFEATNWQAIFYLYELLYQQQPGPIVAFNRAIAMGYAKGAPTGLEALLAIDTLGDNHFYHAALGDFYQKTGALEKTQTAYTQALNLAVLPKEKKLLLEKIRRLEALEGFSEKK